MQAMVLEKAGGPLVARELPVPQAGPEQLLLRVKACGVCRTDLHILDGELPDPAYPIIPGHEIVGEIVELGEGIRDFKKGQRVGVPWLGKTCGHCPYCMTQRENLCDHPAFTGYQSPGGYAEYTVAHRDFVFALPQDFDDLHAAPLLCAGLIGYRAYRMAGEGKRLGLYGFGAAAHLLIQVARYQGREVYAFTRPGDTASQNFAQELGAKWAGDSTQAPPEALDAAILFAPVGALVPQALRALRKGGRVVCAGIHMSDIPAFPYEILWGERSVRSVANLTRQDGREFLELAPKVPIHTAVQKYSLTAANEALADLRNGKLQGAAVLIP